MSRAAAVFPLLFLAGCASAPPAWEPASVPGPGQVTEPLAGEAATHAAKMIGKPYRLGGATPAGFDCSGLVQYGYREAGVPLPHSTDQQRRMAKPVPIEDLRRGDLLFFNQDGKRYGHVGIYLGSGMFVHAPSSGKSVRSDRLDAPYWKRHLTEIRRL